VSTAAASAHQQFLDACQRLGLDPDVMQDQLRMPAGLLLEKAQPARARSAAYWEYLIGELSP
jgi:hypothetical protein